MSHGSSCLVYHRLSMFVDFTSAKDGNPGVIWAAAGRHRSLVLQRAAVALRWSFSAEDEIYSDFFAGGFSQTLVCINE